MTIILDNYTIDEVGWVDLNVQLVFELRVSTQTASQTTQRWIHNQLSLHLHANNPTLVIADQPRWRVPVSLHLPQHAPLSVTTVDVDALTGEIIDQAHAQHAIEKKLVQHVKPQLSTIPFTPHKLPANYLSQQPKPHFVNA